MENHEAVLSILRNNSPAWQCGLDAENHYVFARRYQMRVYTVIVSARDMTACSPSETAKEVIMSFNQQLAAWKATKAARQQQKKKPVLSAPTIFVPHRECAKKAFTVQILEPYYNDLRLLAQSENIPLETIAAQCIEFALKTRKEK